jgi:hypothetical protein
VTEPEQRTAKHLGWLTLAVVALGVFPYLFSVTYGFTLDDANTILGHKGVQGPFSLEDIVHRDWWGRSRFDTIGTWRPLPTLTFFVDRHIGGGRPWLFHADNVVLYAALLVLFDRFLRLWCSSLSRATRLLIVLVFALLAVHADVVPSCTGRAEILAALFSLLAIAIATCTPTLSGREASLSALALFLALLSKESASPMAVLLPFLAHRTHAPKRTSTRGGMLGLAVACPLALGATLAFRVLEMPFMDLGPERAIENPLIAADTTHRLLGALDALGLYTRHLLFGAHLAPDYSFSEPPLLRDGFAGIALGASVALGLAGLTVVSWQRAPRVSDAAMAFGAAYLSVSNVFVAASAIADRLVFFPSLWLVVTVGLAMDHAVQRPAPRRVLGGVAVFFAALQGVQAVRYASTWRDDVSLLGAAVREYPNVLRMQRNLAHALADLHDDDSAAWHLAIAEAIHGNYPAPVARDAIDPAWDGEPLGERLSHLDRTFGTDALCRATTRARARLRFVWEEPAAAELLAGVAPAACPPSK